MYAVERIRNYSVRHSRQESSSIFDTVASRLLKIYCRNVIKLLDTMNMFPIHRPGMNLRGKDTAGEINSKTTHITSAWTKWEAQ